MMMTTFEQMIEVQTYLLAFVVSDYESESIPTPNRVSQILLAKPHGIGDSTFGLVTGDLILSEMAHYFKTSYSLAHMQQIAIPSFGGAMENWGLVIYGEGSLLYNTETGSLNAKHGVAHIIGHEFAHQFFGNLVAPKWWSYIWLVYHNFF